MSKFVNFKKRSVSLPPGCKDLIHLLQPAQRQKANAVPSADDSFIDSLSNIGEYIGDTLVSEARMAKLAVKSLDNRLLFEIYRMEEKTLSIAVAFNQ